MARQTLSLEIVTPDGLSFTETDIAGLVVRRKEKGPLGSEMEVLPMHAPMLARVAPCQLRYYRLGQTHHIKIGGGFMEVKENHVTIVVSVAGQASREQEAFISDGS
jgi:F-type H+-transporting ATPase subunit epsilon